MSTTGGPCPNTSYATRPPRKSYVFLNCHSAASLIAAPEEVANAAGAAQRRVSVTWSPPDRLRVLRQDQVEVAELVPEVAAVVRFPVRAFEELRPGGGLEQPEM